MHALKSPSQLWRALQSDAGLEIRRKNGVSGRDFDVEESLKAALGLAVGDTPLEIWLDADSAAPTPQVSVEKLLVAVLSSQQRYAAMMRDMLDLLISANAGRDGRTLGVQFLFNKVSDPLRFTLEAFRATVERTERILASRVELPSAKALWELRNGLEKVVKSDWSRQDQFLPVALLSKTGNEELDRALGTIAELVAAFRTSCSSFGETRQMAVGRVVKEYPSWDIAEHVAIKERVFAATDFWDVMVLDIVQRIVSRVHLHSISADDTVSKLAPLLDPLDRRDEWITHTYTELLDLLELPTWRQRHELFSVWVGSVLLRTAESEADVFTFLAEDGVLSFAFGGSRLATYSRDGMQFDIWAELRSALVGRSSKRKKGIQPDFRIVRPSLNMPHNAQTRLVLECKHYLTQSVSNFSQAAADYARSCPAATVLVVNYGAIDAPALLASIDLSLHARVAFVGDVTAVSERSSASLGCAIRQAIFPPRAVPHASVMAAQSPVMTGNLAPGSIASIRLRWDATLEDIDLALEVEGRSDLTERIDFRSQGDLSAPPFARLDRDQRNGPNEERIDISAWSAERYVLVATNYTGTGEFAPGRLHCDVTLGTETTVIDCPLLGNVTEWCIATIEIVNGTPHLQTSLPVR
jgi:hypothetical protein